MLHETKMLSHPQFMKQMIHFCVLHQQKEMLEYIKHYHQQDLLAYYITSYHNEEAIQLIEEQNAYDIQHLELAFQIDNEEMIHYWMGQCMKWIYEKQNELLNRMLPIILAYIPAHDTILRDWMYHCANGNNESLLQQLIHHYPTQASQLCMKLVQENITPSIACKILLYLKPDTWDLYIPFAVKHQQVELFQLLLQQSPSLANALLEGEDVSHAYVKSLLQIGIECMKKKDVHTAVCILQNFTCADMNAYIDEIEKVFKTACEQKQTILIYYLLQFMKDYCLNTEVERCDQPTELEQIVQGVCACLTQLPPSQLEKHEKYFTMIFKTSCEYQHRPIQLHCMIQFPKLMNGIPEIVPFCLELCEWFIDQKQVPLAVLSLQPLHVKNYYPYALKYQRIVHKAVHTQSIDLIRRFIAIYPKSTKSLIDEEGNAPIHTACKIIIERVEQLVKKEMFPVGLQTAIQIAIDLIMETNEEMKLVVNQKGETIFDVLQFNIQHSEEYQQQLNLIFKILRDRMKMMEEIKQYIHRYETTEENKTNVKQYYEAYLNSKFTNEQERMEWKHYLYTFSKDEKVLEKIENIKMMALLITETIAEFELNEHYCFDINTNLLLLLHDCHYRLEVPLKMMTRYLILQNAYLKGINIERLIMNYNTIHWNEKSQYVEKVYKYMITDNRLNTMNRQLFSNSVLYTQLIQLIKTTNQGKKAYQMCNQLDRMRKKLRG